MNRPAIKRRMLSVVALLVLVVGRQDRAVASGSRFAPRIVNGVLTAEYPAVGILLLGSDPRTASLQCSGTLIGCSTFLTAGHCVEGDTRPSSYSVFLQHAGFFRVASVTMRPDYSFPVGDVAVLKLATPVTGIVPMPINSTTKPPPGSAGTIVGFGRMGGQKLDYGLKRSGSVTTASCTLDISNLSSVCWDFSNPLGAPGSNSNTCNGDSGGPLFIDLGAGDMLAGVTSGGERESCLPTDQGFDANVYQYASWIATQAGSDLGTDGCGGLPAVGDPNTQVATASGQLDSGNLQGQHSFQAPFGTTTLRIAMNAVDDGVSDFDLYVKAGSPPTTSSFDCSATGSSQYGFCEFSAPASGTWYALVNRVSGGGTYQLTATTFSGTCAGASSEGQACDDNNPCTQNDACRGGICAGTAVADGTSCDDGNACTRPDTCQQGVCTGNAPLADCRLPTQAGVAVLTLQNSATDSRDTIAWRWMHGSATTKSDFGNPTSDTDYTLCVYDESAQIPQLVVKELIPAGGNWTSLTNGYRYVDRQHRNGGISRTVLTQGVDGKAKITITGKGQSLHLPPLPLNQQSTVTVQLLNDTTCWEARYSTEIRNQTDEFKAKSD